MPDVEVPMDRQEPRDGGGIVIRALAISTPAFAYVIASVVYAQPAGGVLTLIGVGAAFALGVAAVISYVGLSKLYPPTTSGNLAALRSFLSERPDSSGTWIARGIIAWAGQLFYWILPGLWLNISVITASYLSWQIWPITARGSLLLILNAAAVLGFGLSFLSLRRMRTVMVMNAVIVITLLVPMLVVVIVALVHTMRPPLAGAWTLDSSGNPTQFVQDTIPDATKTVPHPTNPTRQIQDANATVPKVDLAGNPVWVYDAADANGNVLYDSGGNAIVVPTDMDGKLAPLPPGAAKAVPELCRNIETRGLMKDDKGVWQFAYHDRGTGLYGRSALGPVSGTGPVTISLSQRYGSAAGCIALFTLALFQFIAAMGHDVKWGTKGIRRGMILGAFFFEVAVLCVWLNAPQRIFRYALPLYSSSADSAPIGDIVQLVGGWAFGSARAGWWLMLAAALGCLLILIVSTWMCLATGAGVARNNPGVARCVRSADGAYVVGHFAILLRGGLTVFLAVIGEFLVGLRLSLEILGGSLSGFSQYFGTSRFGAACYALATSFPDVLSTLTLIVALAAIVLFMLICRIYLSAIFVRSGRGIQGKMVAPVIGLLTGTACIVFFVAGPFLVTGEDARQWWWAFTFCTVWGAGVTIRMFLRPRRFSGEMDLDKGFEVAPRSGEGT